MAFPLHNQNQHDLPQILILRKPPVFTILGDKVVDQHFSKKFNLLKAWESPLPLEHFLASHGGSIQGLLTSGSTPITADVLRLLPEVRVVVTTSAGLNHIDLPECRRRGVAVANAANTYSEDVADLAVGLLIDVLRKISAADRFVRKGIWPVNGEYPLGSKLGDKRVGIVGLGNIGQEVAKRLEAFGCKILYTSRNKKPFVSYPFFPNACELATNSDILVICCGLTDQTRHMINKEVMSALGREGIIVNIGRGSIINENEMVMLLVQGEIAGAGLDVFENEPYVPKELFEMDNVVLSPHRAVFTPESLTDLCELLVGNFEAFFSNKPLLSPVTDEFSICKEFRSEDLMKCKSQ